jgi:plastocyanin
VRPAAHSTVDLRQTKQYSDYVRPAAAESANISGFLLAANLLSDGADFSPSGGRMIPVRIGIGAFLVVLMTGCGSGSTMSTPTTPAAPAAVTVTMPLNARTLGTGAFIPNPVTVSLGTIVTWSNADGAAHDVIADGGAWDSGRMAAGGTYAYTFQIKGSFPYHCSLHPGMVGTVTVQ